MTGIIDELVTILGLKVSPEARQNAEKFSGLLKNISGYAEAVSATLMSAATAALYFVQRANEASAEVDKLGDLTGQNKQEIQLWSRAVEQMGGHADAAKRDIIGLTKALNPTMPGEYNNGLFMLFGGNYLSKFKDVNSLLGALADRLKDMPAGKALNWASAIGISTDTLLLLRKGREGVEAFKKQVGDHMPILNDRELKNARAFETHWVRIKQMWEAAAEKASASLAPSIGRIATAMERWLAANKKSIESKLPVFIEGVAYGLSLVLKFMGLLFSLIEKILPVLGDFTEELGGAKAVGYVLAGTLGVLAASLVIIHAKFILIVAAVTAVIAVLKDLYNLISGQDSVMGHVGDTFDREMEQFKSNHPALAKIMNFMTRDKVFSTGQNEDPHTFDAIIARASKAYNVPESLIRSVIRAESGFDAGATGRQTRYGRAKGLMQLLPGTAKDMGVVDPYDPEQNVMGGTRYLRQLLDRYNGSIPWALAAYNWGPSNVDNSKGGLPEETQNYINKILSPSASNYTQGPSMNNTSNINITNNIQGDNAPGIASETSRKMTNQLQTLFPGGRAPVVN